MVEWRLGDLTLDLARPVGAGIVNVTVDSMFEGARSGTPEQAIADGARLVEAGFDMLDVGAVAARSGPPVGVEDECAALLPAIAGVAALTAGVRDGGAARGDGAARVDGAARGGRQGAAQVEERASDALVRSIPVSADTFAVEVARRALDAGAVCVNDISGGCDEMFELVAARGCGYVLMHIEGPPRTDRPWRSYDDVVDHMVAWFEGRVGRMLELGVDEAQIAIDPGLDFDLSPEQDLEVLRRLSELRALALPLYVSLSRKDFIGAVLAGSWEERLAPREREWGTVAAATLAVRAGADVLRIHDRSSLQAVRLAGAVVRG